MLRIFKIIGYRIFQFCFYYGSRVLPWREPKLLIGPGSITKVPDVLTTESVSPVLVVSDKHLMKIGIATRLLRALDEAGIPYHIFDDIEANPSTDTVENLRTFFLEKSCHAFVAIGGGSVIDAAKAAAARIARPKKSLAQLGGFLRVMRRTPLIIAIPTTAGTGSETTIAAVVTDSATHRKYSLSDLPLIPRYAVLDPELTVGLPPAITAATGMDALTHAVESYLCLFLSAKTKQKCIDAVSIIFKDLPIVFANGTDLKARENMLHASYLAGGAFTRAGLNYIHPIAHTLGGLYKIPHGLANAIVLPHALLYYGPVVHKKLARLAVAAGLPTEGKSDAESAADFIRAIQTLNRNLGIPNRIAEIRDEDIPTMINWALKEANPFYPVPKIYGPKELREMIDQIRA
ncbi:MAG: iron-containing alcohol dehydrogenase [Clostridiales bacterium]|nr:iron-containing alcohol dehydrogenase [Clostridiales bacterium]